MGRKRQRDVSIRSVRGDQRLKKQYGELHSAISTWLDGGDYIDIEPALDPIIMSGTVHFPFPQIEEGMSREERIIVLSEQLTTAGQMVTRLKRELSAAQGMCDEIKNKLLVTIAEPPVVPDYMSKLFTQLQAVGAPQGDLQPQSKALAIAMLDAAKAHNVNRQRDRADEDGQDEYLDEPVSTWGQLPERFSGFRLDEIHEEDSKDFDPCPLPPATDIAFFTEDRTRPDFLSTRMETYRSWSSILKGWSKRNGRSMPDQHLNIWAMLLAHRLNNDMSDVSYFEKMECRSPWQKNGIVRIHVLPAAARPHAPLTPPRHLDQFEDDDDVPF